MEREDGGRRSEGKGHSPGVRGRKPEDGGQKGEVRGQWREASDQSSVISDRNEMPNPAVMQVGFQGRRVVGRGGEVGRIGPGSVIGHQGAARKNLVLAHSPGMGESAGPFL